jgi:hypothetical protein
VNLHGRETHLDDLGPAHDVRGRQRRRRESELRNRRQGATRVVLGRPNQDVEIPGEARRAVEGQRVGADDHELNLAGGQQRAELVEVWRQVQ